MKRSTAQQIADRISAEIRQTDPDEVLDIFGASAAGGSGAGQLRKFDNEGNPVGPSDPMGVFSVLTRSAGNGASGTSNLFGNPSLLMLEIETAYYPEGTGSGASNPHSGSKRTALEKRGDLFQSYVVVVTEP